MFSLFPFFLFVLCVIRLAAAQASASLCGCNHSMELLLEEEAGIEVDLKIKHTLLAVLNLEGNSVHGMC